MERDWRRGKVMACLGNMRLHYGDLGDLCNVARRLLVVSLVTAVL